VVARLSLSYVLSLCVSSALSYCYVLYLCCVLWALLPAINSSFVRSFVRSFKTCLICFYDIALWQSYTLTPMHQFRSCYNKCLKIFFGYKRRDSLTRALLAGLPSFDTVLCNAACTLFYKSVSLCCKSIVNRLNARLY